MEKEKIMPDELSKEKLLSYIKSGYLTVGRIKEFIEKHELSDDSIIVVQRVEDIYYEKHHWSVYLKEGEHAHSAKEWNKDIENGKYLDKAKYPKMKEENLKPFTEEQIRQSMEQYSPIWSCVRYKDDKDVLFLDLHY
jgi:hypothetical protein